MGNDSRIRPDGATTPAPNAGRLAFADTDVGTAMPPAPQDGPTERAIEAARDIGAAETERIEPRRGIVMRMQDCALGETLHEGPETIVRRATHEPSGERLIVKMPVSGTPSTRVLGRLLHEHRILGKLAEVSGVVRARALEQEGGHGVLWLEDPGLSSFDRVISGRGRLPLAKALRVAFEVSRVLQGVHHLGVVHKDIKPRSILLDETGRYVVLLDFAIASELAEEATDAAIPEAMEGTLAYISPEQTGRTARRLDARTDLYSLGVVLFEALSGRRPFPETDPLSLVHAHLAKAPPALDSLVPGVPGVVARIVERCLEKHPEKRYQTAKGLAADLERCLQMLEERGYIDPFPLGQKDFSPTLQIPETLFCREKESQEITFAFERAAGGAVEALVLGGPSGVGKTALVRSVYGEIARTGRGLLLSGKHDQLGRSVPYSALAQAFGGFLRNLAASPKPVFDAWRDRIERALGPLSRVIADVVPELSWLMGPLPPLPVVSTEMAYNRFRLGWIELVRAVTDASPPLVLFLDDMQWVDAASVELLKTLLTDVGRKHLLVIAAYRDDEVESGHPLWELVRAMEASGVETQQLHVRPLDEASVREWLTAALSAGQARAAKLAGALWAKTHGNPFFLRQLLLELHREKRVRRNLDDGKWEWDQDAVERAAVTDNVVELMRRRVAELPAETQALLGQAACAGHSFSLSELSVLAGMSQTRVVQDLRPALLLGLVIPQDGQYREAQALVLGAQSAEVDAGYRFLHDRVQQAFYERIALEQRARVHLLIGRRLQTVFESRAGSHQKLLELARHLNLGAPALSSDAERTDLARLNLRAAKAAKDNGSYRLQATLVEQAQGLLGERAWREEPALSVELALERIEADFMLKEFEAVHRRAQELLALPLPALPRLAAQELRVRACLASGQYDEGVRLGLSAIAEQGVHYPETDEECIALTLRWIGELDVWLDQHPEGFSSMSADSSIEHVLCDAIEAAVALCAALGSRPALGAIRAARHVKQAIERELLTLVAPFFIASFAHARSAFLGDYRGSVRWAREGEHAAARLASPLFPECACMRGFYVCYELPVERSREHYRAALRAAAASGSFQGTSWGLIGELYYLALWQGRPLAQCAEKEQAQRGVMARAGDAIGQHIFVLAASYAAFLRAPRSAEPAPGEEWLTASSRSFLAAGDGFVAELARIQEAHLFLAFGEPARALERAEEAERFRPGIYGVPAVTDVPLWRGLAAAKCWSSTLAPPERAVLSGVVEHAVERFRYFSEGCPENFLHKLRLLEAEQARIHGKAEEAMARYDEAIDLARKGGLLHIEALAAQLSAEYHLQDGRPRIGALYLREARDAYSRWGALALAAHLEARHPDLPRIPAITDTAQGHIVTATAAAPDTTSGVALDVHTAIRAAQALSSELDPARVVGRLMEVVLSNAGAQRGALVLVEEDALVLVARLSVGDARIETGLSEPLGQCRDVAGTVVRYVARSREPVVMNDALREERFEDDPYLASRVVRSLLALPLTHRGRVRGVLYLEHRDAPSAFVPSRVELLSVLASQAAIAVENATLYRDVEAQVRALEIRNREIQQLNDELRRQVAQRSRRLMDAVLSSDTSPTIGAELHPGSLLGDCYDVIRRIGKGGMGAVYEVERTTDGVHLAAKVLNHSPDRVALRRFIREAQVLARLSHPNLISILDIDVTNEGVPYIVMEYLRGADLATLVGDHGPMPPARVIRFAIQACAALAEVHDAGIFHRDVKPQNLFVTRAGDDFDFLKLLDFGIARVLEIENDVNLTQTVNIAGTPAFMAPEACQGERADARSDLYALGATVYLLLTGSPPFVGPSQGHVIAAQMSQPPERPSVRRGEPIPEALERLVLRCLAKDPRDRPQTARDLGGALKELAESMAWTMDDSRQFWRIERAAKEVAWESPTLGTITSAKVPEEV